MTKNQALAELQKGATIGHGNFGGYRIRRPDGTKASIALQLLNELEELGLVVRVDDRSSRVGEEWGPAPARPAAAPPQASCAPTG